MKVAFRTFLGVWSRSFFGVHTVFRPKAMFVGMQGELQALHNHLSRSGPQDHDAKSVLITNIPGSGKTHLAREYVFAYRESYPGGVFWVYSSSYQSICAGFTEIAEAAGLLDPLAGESSYEEIKDWDPQCVSKAVDWLIQRQDWLLVLDGIRREDQDAILDFLGILPFRSKYDIIFTSNDDAILAETSPQPYSLPIGQLRIVDA